MMSPLTAHCIYHGDKFRTEYGFVTRNLAKNKVVDSDKFHFLDSAVCCCPGSTNSKFAKITRRKLIQWAERTISNPVSNIHFLAPTLKHFVGLLSLKRGNTDEDKAIHAFLNCIRSLSNGFCSSFARIEPAASRRRTLANKPVEETTVPPPSNNLTTIATNDASLLKPSPSKPVEESTVPPPSYYSTTMATNNNASLLKPRPRLRVPLRIKRVGVRPCTFRRPFRSLPKRPKHGRRKKRPTCFNKRPKLKYVIQIDDIKGLAEDQYYRKHVWKAKKSRIRRERRKMLNAEGVVEIGYREKVIGKHRHLGNRAKFCRVFRGRGKNINCY